jgi:hypothetical protein
MAEKFSDMMQRLRAQEAAQGTKAAPPPDTTELNLDAEAAPPVGEAVPAASAPAPAPAPVNTAVPYKGDDPQAALFNHIANGIRAKYSDKFNLEGLTDQQIIQKHHARFGTDMTPDAYETKLKDVYGKDFQPTLAQRAQPLKKAAGETAVGLAPYAVAEAPAIAAAVLPAAGAVAKGVAGAPAQLGFIGGHLANMYTDEAFILDQERKMRALGLPNVEGRTAEYFKALQPGLSKQGFSNDEIMQEASQRARNVELGRQQTLDSMDQTLDEMQRAQVTEPARAVADAAFLGAGAGPIKRALQSIGLVGREGMVAAKATSPIIQAVKHAATGAIVGGIGLGAQGATRHALEAGAANMTPAQIAQEAVKGGMEEGKVGAEGGAILGGAAGVIEGSIRGVGGLIAGRAAAKAALEDKMAGEVSEANTRALKANQDKVAAQIKADRSAEAYQKRTVADKITNTADTFRADRTRYPLDGDPFEAAKNIIRQEHGDDALSTPEGLRALDKIGGKIKLAQAAEAEVANFGQRTLPPAGAPVEGRPDMTQPGAVAGTGQVPEAAPTEPVRPIEPNQRMQGGAELPPTGLRTQMNELQSPPTPPVAGEAPPIEPAARLAERTPEEMDARLKQMFAGPVAPAPSATEAKAVAPAQVPAPLVAPREEPVSAPTSRESVPAPVAQAASPATPPQEAAPVAASKSAEALSRLSVGEHAVVKEQDGGLHIERLGLPEGKPAERGALGKTLDHITQTADEHGVPVTSRLTKIDSNGGKIPIEKQLKAYWQPRGFEVTASTKLPEGQMATADVRREPIGSHQAQVAGALDKVAEAARTRLASKLGRVNAGFDPSMIGDAALDLAASMFSKRLRDPASLESWLVGKYGEVVKPFVEKIAALAQKHFVRMFKDTGTAEKNLNDLLTLKESGKYGMDWYGKTADWAKQRFGEDSDMFLRFLAVTSANGQTESGAAMALKAFAQWKSGMDFEGFRGESMVGQLKKTANGEALPENSKIKNFLDALRGDPNAVVLDRWMLDAMNMKDVGGALKPDKYKIYDQVVKQLARDNEMTPRQFQAAVWEGARVRKALTSEATGGRALSSKIGSARPLDQLVDRKLGGLTPDEYAKESTGHLKMMDSLYKGLAPVRTAIEKTADGWQPTEGAQPENSGHTFNPDTFAPAKYEGNVTTLLTHNTDHDRLYPGRILKFREQVQPLITELKAKGLKPTIGVWQLSGADGKPSGQFSIDLNIMVGDEQKALDLARSNRQFAIAKLGPGGEWQKNIDTGYSGKQNLPPTDYREQPAWYKQQMNRVRSFIKKAGL